MDLLGGYDSNDNSDPEDSNEDNNNTIKNLKHENSNGTELTSKAAQNAASTTKTEIDTNTKAEKRGRKILSLNAVLPSNIFNQLVMQKGNTINKGVSDDESSSSDDDHDDDEVTQGSADVDTMKKSRKKARKRFRTNNDEKEGLQSLLHELHSIKGGNVSTNNDPIKRNSNGAVNSNDITNYNKKEDVDLDNSVEIETTTTKATPAIRSTAFSSIPRPSSSNMYKNTLPRPKAPAPSQPVQSHVTQQYHTQEEEQKQPPLSQKQIIQALRKGNIPSSIPTIQMSGHTVDPSDIEITQDHHASASTIPNPQLELYNPNQGKMVSAQEVRHKRKNQIHHLLKQAHVLESTKPVSGGAGNSSRADAKKKYGW